MGAQLFKSQACSRSHHSWKRKLGQETLDQTQEVTPFVLMSICHYGLSLRFKYNNPNAYFLSYLNFVEFFPKFPIFENVLGLEVSYVKFLANQNPSIEYWTDVDLICIYYSWVAAHHWIAEELIYFVDLKTFFASGPQVQKMHEKLFINEQNKWF